MASSSTFLTTSPFAFAFHAFRGGSPIHGAKPTAPPGRSLSQLTLPSTRARLLTPSGQAPRKRDNLGVAFQLLGTWDERGRMLAKRRG